jgi:cysteinyl-tRNA synthetase
MALEFYNSLTKNKEVFDKSPGGTVGLYTCGPTVYDFVTIGNWRTYTLGDLICRTLSQNGYKVKYVMNITDVGHLTGDNEGDADTGVDRMEKAKAREGKNAWDIAQFYTDDFLKSYEILNLSKPMLFSKATDHIAEQIDLVGKLEENGLTYKTSDGIYFDTKAYEEKGFHYGELSNLSEIKEGARVEINHEKKNPRDFALWKFSPKDTKRDMEWESPWGVGFPGWHIECSAMSMKYLGEQFDIHAGGEDLKSTHHPNEIAQSQGATGKKPFVKYWIHGAFLQVDGGKMGKSLGNAYSLEDVIQRGYSPITLRYFYLTAHYSSSLNFTWEALNGAENALKRLYRHFLELGEDDSGVVLEAYKERFLGAINNDLNMPAALAVLWDLLSDTVESNADKRATILYFDEVLGLGLNDLKEEEIPENVSDLIKKRDLARTNKNWEESDEIRKNLEELGYEVSDTSEGTKIIKI